MVEKISVNSIANDDNVDNDELLISGMNYVEPLSQMDGDKSTSNERSHIVDGLHDDDDFDDENLLAD